jgi:hypothetical protein
MNYITFDIETYSPSYLKHIDTSEFRTSVVGAYISWIDKYLAFFESEIEDFLKLLLEADLIVGFNHLWFDFPVLQKYCSYNLSELPSYDLLLEFEKQAGFKIKLNDLCKANLTDDIKTDSYQQFKNYHKENKWFELADYCLNDVRLTENLFRLIRSGKTLKYFDLHQQKEVLLAKPVASKNQIKVGNLSESIF